MRKITDISTLPEVAIRIMKVANDPGSGAVDLLGVVETDVPLSSRILRTVNSACFGLKVEVSNLRQAIGYLGCKQVRNLAMTGSVGRIFRQDLKVGNYRRIDLWRHLVSVAVCSKMIARRLRISDFDEAFLAGLLHDMGIILIDQYQNDHFVKVIQKIKEGTRLTTTERSILGFDHTTLGAAVAERWRFPPLMSAVMRHHHRPEGYTGEHRHILDCVAVANFVCSLQGITSVGCNLVQLPRASFENLHLHKDDLLVLAEDLESELAGHKELFRL
ncbi:MAG: HDOD domain-containing protein [Planctomycetota bacterium]